MSFEFTFGLPPVPVPRELGRSSILGKGLKSPLQIDPVTGDFARVEGEENVRQCLRDGVLTRFGERVFQEGLGTVVPDLVFEDASIITDLVVPSVREFIDRYEPRITLRGVQVNAVPIDRSDVRHYRVRVSYVIRATNTQDNLVFPFFVIQEGAF